MRSAETTLYSSFFKTPFGSSRMTTVDMLFKTNSFGYEKPAIAKSDLPQRQRRFLRCHLERAGRNPEMMVGQDASFEWFGSALHEHCIHTGQPAKNSNRGAL